MYFLQFQKKHLIYSWLTLGVCRFVNSYKSSACIFVKAASSNSAYEDRVNVSNHNLDTHDFYYEHEQTSVLLIQFMRERVEFKIRRLKCLECILYCDGKYLI